MNQDTIRSILRLVAVVTILLSAILVTMSVIALVGASIAMVSATAGMQVQLTGVVGKMGVYALLTHGSIAAWGLVLYAMSSTLAQKIVDGGGSDREVKRSRRRRTEPSGPEDPHADAKPRTARPASR